MWGGGRTSSLRNATPKLPKVTAVEVSKEQGATVECSDGSCIQLDHNTLRQVFFQDEEPIEKVTDETISRMSYHAIMYIDDSGHRTFEADRIEKGPPCRFHRKLGEDRFLTVTMQSRGDSMAETHRTSQQRQILPKHLEAFSWLGRHWELFRSKVQKQDKRHRKDPGAKRLMQYTFFATRGWTSKEEEAEMPELPETCADWRRRLRSSVFWNRGTASMSMIKYSVETVYRTHIPQTVRSSCPPTCRQHFLCRNFQNCACHPEEMLKDKGKYVKRLDLGFTAAWPTIQFDSCQIYEEADLKNRGGKVLTDACIIVG